MASGRKRGRKGARAPKVTARCPVGGCGSTEHRTLRRTYARNPAAVVLGWLLVVPGCGLWFLAAGGGIVACSRALDSDANSSAAGLVVIAVGALFVGGIVLGVSGLLTGRRAVLFCPACRSTFEATVDGEAELEEGPDRDDGVLEARAQQREQEGATFDVVLQYQGFHDDEPIERRVTICDVRGYSEARLGSRIRRVEVLARCHLRKGAARTFISTRMHSLVDVATGQEVRGQANIAAWLVARDPKVAPAERAFRASIEAGT